MTVTAPFTIVLPVFAAIPSVLYLSISKGKNPVTFGSILAGIHLAFVLCAAHDRYAHKSESPGFDFLLHSIDVPISLVFGVCWQVS